MTRLRHLMPRFKNNPAALRTIAVGVLASVFGCAAAAGVRVEAGAPAGSKTVSFNRDIRPILADKCFKCHGPDARERKGKLRLDNAQDAAAPAASGSVAIVAGKLDDSELYQRITVDGLRRADAAAQERQDALGRRGRQAQDLDRRGGRVSRALGVSAPAAPATALGEECRLVPHADRPVHPGPAGGRGTQALARGRQGDLDPAARAST